MRSIGFATAAVAVAIGTLLAAGCGSTGRHLSLSDATTASTPPASTSVIPNTTSVSTAASTDTAATTPPSVAVESPTTPATSRPTPITTVSAAQELPISVESDSQMKAEGNGGPSSSILLPTSCLLSGTTVSAEGTYTNGGFVPDVYNRYGDVIVLYVFGAPSPGYPQGIQLGVSTVGESPVVGTLAPWRVSSLSVGKPGRCVVAAQPTHDVQLAP